MGPTREMSGGRVSGGEPQAAAVPPGASDCTTTGAASCTGACAARGALEAARQRIAELERELARGRPLSVTPTPEPAADAEAAAGGVLVLASATGAAAGADAAELVDGAALEAPDEPSPEQAAALEARAAACSALVAVLSPACLRSAGFLRGLRAAAAAGRRVVLLHDAASCDFPPPGAQPPDLDGLFAAKAVEYVAAYRERAGGELRAALAAGAEEGPPAPPPAFELFERPVAYRVFVAYRQATGGDAAGRLYEALARHYRTFMDCEARFRLYELEALVARSQTLLLVLSHGLWRSEWCLRELRAALRARCRLLFLRPLRFPVPATPDELAAEGAGAVGRALGPALTAELHARLSDPAAAVAYSAGLFREALAAVRRRVGWRDATLARAAAFAARHGLDLRGRLDAGCGWAGRPPGELALAGEGRRAWIDADLARFLGSAARGRPPPALAPDDLRAFGPGALAAFAEAAGLPRPPSPPPERRPAAAADEVWLRVFDRSLQPPPGPDGRPLWWALALAAQPFPLPAGLPLGRWLEEELLPAARARLEEDRGAEAPPGELAAGAALELGVLFEGLDRGAARVKWYGPADTTDDVRRDCFERGRHAARRRRLFLAPAPEARAARLARALPSLPPPVEAPGSPAPTALAPAPAPAAAASPPPPAGEEEIREIAVFVDAPDPDNFVLLLGLARLYPAARLHVVLTGRPVPGAHPAGLDGSRLVQRINAARLMAFLRACGHPVACVYDGGIAPRTPVPHALHVAEYKDFRDVDPVDALQMCPALAPAAALARLMLAAPDGAFLAAVGGPLTGLHALLVQCPAAAAKLREVHAMLACWGRVELMSFGEGPRGALQFNVACDPHAAHFVLTSLPCPVYLAPTEVTRVPAIGFADCGALAAAIGAGEAGAGFARDSVEAALRLYTVWYDAAVLPRKATQPGELIYIHDLAPALTLRRATREAVYDFVPVEIAAVPARFDAPADWGAVRMRELEPGAAPAAPARYAARALAPGGPAAYLRALRALFVERAPAAPPCLPP